MKQKFIFSILFAFLSLALSHADEFTDILQDLAIQTACIGQYSATQAGGGWYDDPHDYYTPHMMAQRFKNMSGNMTRTATFYGVCFDYAEMAYWDIKNYQSLYNKAGMYEGQFWIAGVHADSSTIILSNPTSRENATEIQNGVYVRTYGSASYRDVRTHKQTNGTRATHHAWLWVERADGVWFWIDPTWTDNLGYVVYGYVSGGEEIQCRPDEKYCVNYPESLKNLPNPPKMGKRKETSNTATASRGSSHSYGSHWSMPSIDIRQDNPWGGDFDRTLSVGIALRFKSIYNLFNDGENDDGSVSVTNFSFSYEDGNTKKYPLFFQIDTYNNEERYSVLFGGGIGRQFGEPIALYAGCGLGWTSSELFGFDSVSLAFKMNGGIRITQSFGAIRLDVAYASEHGFMFGTFYGFCF